jgi:hypothetical protein
MYDTKYISQSFLQVIKIYFMRRAYLLVIIFHFINIQEIFSQTEKIGQMIIAVPQGWKFVRYQNACSITPALLPKGEYFSVDVMSAMQFNGNLKQALEKSYDDACKMYQVTRMREVNGGSYNATEPKTSFRGWEYIRANGGVQAPNQTGYSTEFGLEVFVIKINERYERIAIAKSRNNCGGLSRFYPTDRLEYSNAIERLLFSLQFSDRREPATTTTTAKGNGIVGAWQGISMSVGLTKPGAKLGAELKTKELIFFSNGQAFFGNNFPVEGLDELDTWIKAENNRRDWGTWNFSNGKGMLKLPYANMPLRVEGNKLIITTNKTDHAFIKLTPVDGIMFQGNYLMSEAYGTRPSIQFTAAGTFMDKGAIRVLYHEYIDCLNPAINPGSGKYEIRNHSVVFKYNDGRKIKIAFTGAGYNKNDPSKLVLSFNHDQLLKAGN